MAGEPQLSRGSEGEWVEYLQQMLGHVGQSPGAVDGDFDASTERAVRSLQESVGLTADGVVGATTWAALTGGGTGDTGDTGDTGADEGEAGASSGELDDPDVPDDLVAAGAPANYDEWSGEQRQAFFWQGEEEEFDEDAPDDLEVVAISDGDGGGSWA